MTNRLYRPALMLVAICLVSPVFAGDRESTYYITPSLNLVDDDPDRVIEDAEGFGLTLGVNYSPKWSFEGFIEGTDFDGDANNAQDHLEVGVNALRVFNREGWFSPYLLGGVGSLYEDLGDDREEQEAVGSLGAGVLLSPTENFGLRLQYRYRAQLGGMDFEDNIYTLGFQFAFGGSGPRFSDSDNDGVTDDLDRCPRTPLGRTVGSDGCEFDSDNDGVVDAIDNCPNTRAGVEVDATGCEIVRDGDGDGVVDGMDQCPSSPAGVTVDAKGCEVDTDGDSVVDSKDRCPNTVAGVRVDIRGCEIKAVIRLPGVNFETNSDRLVPGAEQVLNDAAATLRKNPDLVVEVAGHTDSDGAAEYNESLSARRAREVRNYLVNAGANEANLSVRGYGEAEPIADNSTREGKAANRRVELRIIE